MLTKSTAKKTLSNFFKYLKKSWPTIRTWLVKTLLKKFLPKLISGPWGWVVTFFGEYVFDKVLKPGWEYITRKGFALWRKMFNMKKAKKLENSKTENDFDRSFDDMP